MNEQDIEMLKDKTINLVHFTYKPSELPKSRETAIKELRNYVSKVRKYEKQKKLPKCKYFSITHLSQGGNWHHHIIFADASEVQEICALWKKGIWSCQENLSPKLKEEALSYFLIESKFQKKELIGKGYGIVCR